MFKHLSLFDHNLMIPWLMFRKGSTPFFLGKYVLEIFIFRRYFYCDYFSQKPTSRLHLYYLCKGYL